MNDTRKNVVTSQPLEVEWANSVSVGSYDPAAIARLRDEAQPLTLGGVERYDNGALHLTYS